MDSLLRAVIIIVASDHGRHHLYWSVRSRSLPGTPELGVEKGREDVMEERDEMNAPRAAPLARHWKRHPASPLISLQRVLRLSPVA